MRRRRRADRPRLACARSRAATSTRATSPPRSPGSAGTSRRRTTRAARWSSCRARSSPGSASGVVRVDPSNASSTMLLDLRPRDWSGEACEAFDVDPERLPPILAPQSVLGPVAPWLREAAGPLGLDDGRARLRRRDGGHARRRRGRARRGLRRDGHGRAGLRGDATCRCTTPTGVVELHPHADPGELAAREPGLALGRRLPLVPRPPRRRRGLARPSARASDVYELLNAVAAEAPAGADGLVWLPALAGAMTPEWNARARATWFGLTPSHGRAAPAARAARGQRARAARRARRDPRPGPRDRPSSSASPAARRAGSRCRSAPT